MNVTTAILSLTVVTSAASLHATVIGPEMLSAARPHAVHVAPPTGERTRDHASIVAAFGQAGPGDTIQFGSGTYIVGEMIQDSTPGLTLLGAAQGTVLRGCTPEGYERTRREERAVMEKAEFGQGRPHLPPADRARMAKLVKRCGMFQLSGGHDTVRDLTFGYTRAGLDLGHEYQQGYRPSPGGYLVEGNTFRNSDNGIRIGLWSPDSSVIRRNTFVDTYHAVMAGGSHIDVLENTVLAPAPSHVPADQFPSLAIAVTAMAGRPGGASPPAGERCRDDVIAGNVIDGYPSGIAMGAAPGMTCRNNVIRDNTIAVRRVPILPTSVGAGLFPLDDPTDSTWVGVPIRVGGVEETRIEGNRVLGAEGYGLSVMHASHDRIENNTIVGILRREPFPGNANSGPKSPNANGAGIWVASGSHDNQLLDNTFEDIATYAVVLEGDRNTVRTLRASDRVRDLGRGNEVTGSPSH
ncbi:MAG: right-handed parallel beta-helix repeat-containing protein [Candidatus Palauibacterales bacterium]|nr:right-handed parallel beta-helix repeat-containing protein [Candidatus Palauibacterales bacterium]MDP2529110.1 right-handed parallel beta-helix repeat-containing protein [Candidatus Palauibacterales bacterium]MDP2583943.1 right-handed parallel beta-helix repeat-containing protein [Candidatus Palauibacterales bacterium]